MTLCQKSMGINRQLLATSSAVIWLHSEKDLMWRNDINGFRLKLSVKTRNQINCAAYNLFARRGIPPLNAMLALMNTSQNPPLSKLIVETTQH